jgi:hypothetical protein
MHVSKNANYEATDIPAESCPSAAGILEQSANPVTEIEDLRSKRINQGLNRLETLASNYSRSNAFTRAPAYSIHWVVQPRLHLLLYRDLLGARSGRRS